jgi:leucyl aminopeptidase (aminopeptidase T)
MGSRQLDRLGVNRSTIHTDVMFGSASVSVVATESREGEVVLIDRGRWAERFRHRLGPSTASK